MTRTSRVLAWLFMAALTSPLLALNPASVTSPTSPGTETVSVSKPSVRLAESLSALKTLESVSSGTWSVRWDARRGTPARIFGAATQPMGQTPEEAAQNFLAAHGDVFAMSTGGRDLKTVLTQESLGGHHVRMVQHHQGVPVRGGDVSVHLDKDLRVQVVNSSYAPLALGLTSLQGTLSREEALEVARVEAKVTGVLRSDPIARTVIDASSDAPVLSWEVVLPSMEPLGDFEVLVDASTGDVRSIRNLLMHARGRIFNPNPVVTLKDNTIRDQNDADYAGLSGAYVDVDLLGLSTDKKLKGQYVDVTAGASGNDSSDGNFFFNRKQKAFERVMIYFHIDRAQRYIQSIGFNNANNRTQLVDAHGTTQDNSWYSPATKQLTFGDGGVDDAEDSDIIMHEYGHSTHDNQVPGWGSHKEGRAMGEGFGDYLAASLRADKSFQRECVGSWDGVSYSNAPEPCLRRLDSTKHWPEDRENQEHADGELWSASLWQIWNVVGKEKADKIILESHFYVAPNGTFADASNAIIQADQNLYGGANKSVLKSILVARGFIESSGTLKVVLKEAGSGNPVRGRIEISGQDEAAEIGGDTGVAEFSLIPGTYTIKITSFGYITGAEQTVTVEEDQTTTLELELEAAPRFTVTGSVKSAGTGEALSARILIVGTPLDPVQTAGDAGTFSIELPQGTYTLKALAFGYRTGTLADVVVAEDMEVEFSLQDLPPVLLVDDDEGKTHETFFQAALAETDHDVWNMKTSGAINGDNLLGYATVVWFTGSDYQSTLTATDQTLLKQYLESGGRLFITGQELAYALKGKPFLSEVLGAEFVADSAGSKVVQEAEGLEFSIEGGDGANNQQYPDVVKPAGDGSEAFLQYKDTEGHAALKVERGAGRIVYFAFGFEGISTAEHRTQMMKSVMDYLKPSLAERVARLVTFDEVRREAPASESGRWMSVIERYEGLMARELEHASEAERGSIRGLLSIGEASKFRDLKAVLQSR